jgi:hypothetical protein
MEFGRCNPFIGRIPLPQHDEMIGTRWKVIGGWLEDERERWSGRRNRLEAGRGPEEDQKRTRRGPEEYRRRI